MRSSIRSGRLASVGPGPSSTRRQRAQRRRRGERVPVRAGQRGQRERRTSGRGSPPCASTATSAATSPSSSTAAASSDARRARTATGRTAGQPVERPRRLDSRSAVSARRSGARLAVAEGLEQRADPCSTSATSGGRSSLGAVGSSSRRSAAVMPAPTIRSGAGSNAGGSVERSTSRLSTPSTVSRTHCAPGGDVAELERERRGRGRVRLGERRVAAERERRPPGPGAPAAGRRARRVTRWVVASRVTVAGGERLRLGREQHRRDVRVVRAPGRRAGPASTVTV